MLLKKRFLDEFDLIFIGLRVTALVAAAIWLVTNPVSSKNLTVIVWSIGFLLYSTLFYALIFLKFRDRLRETYPYILIPDIAYQTAMQLSTGGLTSPFFLTYYLSATLHGLIYGLPLSMAVSFSISLIISVFNFSQISGMHFTEILFRIGFLWAIGVAGGLIGNKMIREKNEIIRLNKTTKEQLEKLTALYDIGKAISSWIEIKPVLDSVISNTAKLLNAEYVLILLSNCKTGELDVVSHYGDLKNVANYHPSTIKGKSLEGAVFSSGQAVLIEDTSSDSQINKEHFKTLGIDPASLIYGPLKTAKETFGVLLVINKNDDSKFTKDDLDTLALLTSGVSVSIDNAKLYEQSKDNLMKVNGLLSIVAAIGYSSNLTEIFRIAIENLRNLFSIDHSNIYLIEKKSGNLKLLDISTKDGDAICMSELLKQKDCRALVDGRPLIVNDNQTHPCFIGKNGEIKTGSSICMPLRAGISTLGVIRLSSNQLNQYKESDNSLAKGIGEQLAIAVQRANLFGQINDMAITDPLTKLFNLREFKNRLSEEFKRSERYHRPLSLLMIDADHFKEYNDRMGHTKGDIVLKKISSLLREYVRETDNIFRYGGEEICVLLPETDKEQARIFAERLRQIVEEYRFDGQEEQPNGNMTISIGVASIPYDAVSTEGLIDKADKAMYDAKQKGRNLVCVYKRVAFKVTEVNTSDTDQPSGA